MAESTVELLVHTPVTPEKAVGMIITPQGISEKTGVPVTIIEPGLIQVSVPVASSEAKKDSFATSITITEGGELFFSPLKSIADPKRYGSHLSLPICKNLKVQNRTLDENIMSNIGAVQSLLEIRKVRRDFVKLELSALLRGDFLEKLERMETGFGLAGATPLSAEMNPYELTSRLFRILAAVRNYEANK